MLSRAQMRAGLKPFFPSPRGLPRGTANRAMTRSLQLRTHHGPAHDNLPWPPLKLYVYDDRGDFRMDVPIGLSSLLTAVTGASVAAIVAFITRILHKKSHAAQEQSLLLMSRKLRELMAQLDSEFKTAALNEEERKILRARVLEEYAHKLVEQLVDNSKD